MEKSIGTLKQNTSKNEMMSKTNIKEKTVENTKLIKELNELREKKKELEKELEDLQLKFQKLNLEIKRKRMENEKRNIASGYISHNQFGKSIKDGGPLEQTGATNQFYSRPKSGITQESVLPKLGQANSGQTLHNNKCNY